jgi:hypothetical protein
VLLSFTLTAAAHVGNPDIYMEGHAGPYMLYVTIRMPQVIPGVAEIEIRSESPDVREIRVAPMQLTGPGSKLAPTPDIARRAAADPQFFTGSLWLMEFGSLQVHIEADGTRGKGDLAVPVPAIAQRTLPMQRPLGITLAALMLLLALGLISIAAAAVREGALAPGTRPAPDNLRRAKVATTISSVVVIALLFIGWKWWRAEAVRYEANVYTPPEIDAVLDRSGRLALEQKPTRMALGSSRRPAQLVDFKLLIPDHGHLMHLFLVRMPAMDSFWHLHPERDAQGEFVENLPAIQSGHYDIFADIVLKNGFPITMIGQLDIPEFAGRPLTGDDSGIVATPLSESAADTLVSLLPDGGRMVWERPQTPLRANTALLFRFRVEDRDGKPARNLEPYMRMAAHAEIIRSDVTVFAHVHPAGSVSMAALDLAQAGLPGAVMDAAGMAPMNGMAAMNGLETQPEHVDSEISFPYGFPNPGLYRLFVQIKRAGQVETAIFDTKVE